jgi:osmotically-inducible protein OsmY
MKKRNIVGQFLLLLMVIGVIAAWTSIRTHESAGEYVDDSVITTKVKSLLASDNFLKSFQISVKTYQGSVQLGGLVDSPKAVDKADEIVKNVKGVAGIKNNLIVKQVREEYRAIEHQG